MFNLKKTHHYVERKQIKKENTDNTPILSDSNDFLLNHKL